MTTPKDMPDVSPEPAKVDWSTTGSDPTVDDQFEETDSPRELVSLPQWRYAPDAWRWIKRLDNRRATAVFRLRSARVLPASLRARFLAMGVPAEALESTLRDIRSTADWSEVWIQTAQRYLGDYRRQVSSKNLIEGAQAKRVAALCYHAAQVFAVDGGRTVRMCRAATASLFGQALPYLIPDARQVQVPWRSTFLPGLLQMPTGDYQSCGLVVLLNGATTGKEEVFAWSAAFLRAGIAVLALDSPGTGEATSIAVTPGDDDDILDGVFEVFAHDRDIDLSQVSVVGVSMGGNQAVRCATYDRRIMSAIAVTPPYEPARWLHRASPILLDQIQLFLNMQETEQSIPSEQLSLYITATRLRCPLLVFGGARDVIVPPSEAQLLAARAGAIATLVWYPDGGHCLYSQIRSWTAEAAIWLGSVAAARALEMQSTGHADTEIVAMLAREQLLTADPNDLIEIDNHDEGSARLLNSDEVDALGSSARMIDMPKPVRDDDRASVESDESHERDSP